MYSRWQTITTEKKQVKDSRPASCRDGNQELVPQKESDP